MRGLALRPRDDASHAKRQLNLAMFSLSTPFWELLARAGLIYFSLLILVRLSGKRTIGQFSPFDVIVMLLLAEAAAGGLTGGDQSVGGALVIVSTLIGLNYAMAFLSTRNRRVETLMEGAPVVLVNHGELVPGVLKRENLPAGELDQAMRGAGIRRREDVQLAILEPDGKISFFRRHHGS